MKELEHRSYQCEVRAEGTEEGNIIIGRPIVYGSRTDIGYFDEVIDMNQIAQSREVRQDA